MSKNARPLLEFTTTDRSPRLVIAIDGQPYTLRHPHEMSAVDLHVLRTKIPQAVAALKKGDAMNDGERAAVSTVITRLCNAIVDAPPTVLKQLTELQRLAMIDTYRTSGDHRPGRGARQRRRAVYG